MDEQKLEIYLIIYRFISEAPDKLCYLAVFYWKGLEWDWWEWTSVHGSNFLQGSLWFDYHFNAYYVDTESASKNWSFTTWTTSFEPHLFLYD